MSIILDLEFVLYFKLMCNEYPNMYFLMYKCKCSLR